MIERVKKLKIYVIDHLINFFYFFLAKKKFIISKFDSKETSILRKEGIVKIQNFDKKNNNYQSLMYEVQTYLDQIKYEDLIDKNSIKNYRIHITKHFDDKILYKCANDKNLLELASKYFKKKAKAVNWNVWLDYPLEDQVPTGTQIYHRDYDNYFLLKTFFYISDVGLENGPFQYLNKTHIDRKKYSSIQLQELERYSLTNCVGEKGTMILSDTNGYHKGALPLKGYRALFTCMYTSF